MDDYNGHDDDVDDGEMHDASAVPEQGQARRACDLCRLRKVACDREEPCSTCIRGSAQCTYTVHQAFRPKRQRVLISAQYEKKIDRIEDRLNQVIDLLQGLTTVSAGPEPTTAQQDVLVVERPRATVQQRKSAASLKDGPKPGQSWFEQQQQQRESTSSQPSHNEPRKPTEHATTKPPVSTTPTTSSGYGARSASRGATAAADSPGEPPDPTFEGESSLSAQAGFASRFIEEAVSSTPDKAFGGEIDETLSALRQLVGAQAQSSFGTADYPNARPSSGSSSRKDRPMPSVQLVMSCLSIARHRVDVQAFWMSGFMTFEMFMQTTVEVYFAPSVTDAQYLIVNIGVYWLFMSLIALSHDEPWPGISEDELDEASVLCRENTETCLAALPYHLPNTLDYVNALSFAGGYALEMSKASLAWSLLTSAIHICQNLGFHRASVLEKDKPAVRDQKYRLFWGLYVLEKSLALRLGRASVLQDCDISLPRPDKRADGNELWDKDDPWDVCMAYCCGMANIQGRIYTQLFSPGALLEEDSVRAVRAQALADEIAQLSGSQPHDRVREVVQRHVSTEVLGENGKFNFRDSPFGAVEEAIASTNLSLEYLLKCLQIQQLCLLTLVYRAVPVPQGSPSVFTQDCIDVARQSLALHQNIVASIPATNTNLIDMYFSWTILAVPFAPFIVIFCHIIESATRNHGTYQEDLQRLENFTISLDPGVGRLSGATGRLQKLCQVLYNVARKYADLKASAAMMSQEHPSQSQQREFNSYIHALGLFGNMPMTMDPGVGAGGGGLPSVSDAGAGGLHSQSLPTMPGLSQQQQQHHHGHADSIYAMPAQMPSHQHFQQEQGAMLGEWFYGGQQMLGLLEQPTFDFDEL
ncbi:uncharacterized protein B0I36DRAFT_330785 [Microdochium trichocladiopsis]|uniref:Zn(2)-C6 fungal-type domain-containing protein n=1 Tax=Microdochium trichocladiopsis TaxID=1682393 RepID=A0A9P8Y0F1_9PEZI|nr:uncharacterized protein B0I36DRAFT_330785 [Microdochium trichocladiopsis]KAH7026509.1 hypothetical protein B0I36DRAFT_330785 [Microdochium trichocladiopsis]